ncbi:MAG: FHA domain-containing protein, partial [Nitrosomonas ureae]
TVEGVIVKRSIKQTLRGALFGAGIGLVSGMMGLIIGEIVFLLIKGGLLARALGWMIFGLTLGLGQGLLDRRSRRRISYSALGGTIAGLLGGLVFELLTQVFLAHSTKAQVILSGLGLILIGASLGGIIPISLDVLRRAARDKGTLVIKTGPRTGLEVPILDSVRIGSYDGCEVYLPGDPQIAKEHARVFKSDTGFIVLPISGLVQVNGQAVDTSKGFVLTSGYRIQVGNTNIVFEGR